MPTVVDSVERAATLVREGAFSDYWVFEKTEAIRGGKDASVRMQVYNYILGKDGEPDFQGLDVFEVFQRGRRLVLRLWWRVAS
jgi:hypothetical protein